MSKCWLADPVTRPSFTEIHNWLNITLAEKTLGPQSVYTYIRVYTKEIPDDYVINPSVAVSISVSSFTLLRFV